MIAESSPGVELRVPYWREKEVISHPRYHWSTQDRGKEPFVILQWTLAGEGIFEYRGKRHRVPAGHALIAIVPESASYYYPPDGREPWTLTWLNFYGSFACDIFRELRNRFGPVVPLSSRGTAAASLRRLMKKSDHSQSSDRIQTSLQAYTFVLEWWREASQPTGRVEDRLARALQFSRDHFREPLGVKQLAAEAGMTREHFSRIFTGHTGESPSACLRRLRIDEATFLIRDTDLPLREIAMRSGFYSERHLMRTFQRVHRTNPSEFRRKKKK